MCIRGCQDDNFHKNQIEQKLKFYPSVFQEKSQALVGFPLQNKIEIFNLQSARINII